MIHVIDSVIMPTDKSIVETAAKAGTFKTLLAAAKAAGLAETLNEKGPFTVFAPTDEAFAKLPKGTVEMLLKPENKQKLVDILTYHVVSGRVYSEEAVKAKSAKTLQGAPITVLVKSGAAMINESKLVATDLDASNGVIHVIDAVLMPPPKAADARTKLEDAVVEGTKLFNAGHHDACAKIYDETMTELMSSEIPSSLKSHMTGVLHSARQQHCSTERAWTLRRGIDQVHQQLTASH